MSTELVEIMTIKKLIKLLISRMKLRKIITELRDGVLSPRGPHQLVGLGPGGDHGGLRSGGGLLRPDTMTSMIRPEFMSTTAANTKSTMPLPPDRHSSPEGGGFSWMFLPLPPQKR